MTEGREHLRARDIALLTGVSMSERSGAGSPTEIIPSVKVGGARLVPEGELAHLLSTLQPPTEEAIAEDMNNGENKANSGMYRESLVQEHVPSIL